MTETGFSERQALANPEESLGAAVRGAAAHFGCDIQTSLRSGVPATIATDTEDSHKAVGYGKGRAAAIGSVGECIERLVYNSIGREAHELWSSREIISQGRRHRDAFLCYALEALADDVKIPCLGLERIGGDSEKYFVPRGYVNFRYLSDMPNECAKILRRYVSTNGIAFGFTPDESTLHALNEVIERDFVSEFFMKIFDTRLKTKNIIFEINIDECVDLANLNNMEDVGRVMAFQSRTVFGPFATVLLAQAHSHQGFLAWGAGASLNRLVSIQRAVDECVQMLSLKKCRPIDEQTQDRLKLSRLGAGSAFPKRTLNGDSCGGVVDAMSIGEQVAIVTGRITAAGFSAWSYAVPICDAFSVAFVHIPRAERYFMNYYGLYALPSQIIEQNA